MTLWSGGDSATEVQDEVARSHVSLAHPRICIISIVHITLLYKSASCHESIRYIRTINFSYSITLESSVAGRSEIVSKHAADRQ